MRPVWRRPAYASSTRSRARGMFGPSEWFMIVRSICAATTSTATWVVVSKESLTHSSRCAATTSTIASVRSKMSGSACARLLPAAGGAGGGSSSSAPSSPCGGGTMP